MNNENEILIQIKEEISGLKNTLSHLPSSTLTVSDKWIPRSAVMTFLNYGDTQMAAIEKAGELVVTKVGKRKFIHKDSLEKLLAKNIIR